AAGPRRRRRPRPPPPAPASPAADGAARACRAARRAPPSTSGCPARTPRAGPPPRTSSCGRSRGRTPADRGRRLARPPPARGWLSPRPSRRRAQAQALAPVPVRLHRLAPGAVVQVPADGGRDPGREVVARLPAQLGPRLGVVDGVAPVVPRPVGDEAL